METPPSSEENPLTSNGHKSPISHENNKYALEERRGDNSRLLNMVEELKPLVSLLTNNLQEIQQARGVEFEDLSDMIRKRLGSLRYKVDEIVSIPYGREMINKVGILNILGERPSKIDPDELKSSFRRFSSVLEEDKDDLNKINL